MSGALKRDEWETVRLGDVCKFVGGGTPAKSNQEYYTGLIPWATVSDMGTDIISDTIHHITEEAIKNSATNLIEKNTIIISTHVGVGKVCIISKDTALNQDLKAVFPDEERVFKKYLFHWFKSVAPVIIRNSRGGTVKGVTLQFISNLDLSLPPLDVQRRIADTLDKVTELITLRKTQLEKLDELVKARFVELMDSAELSEEVTVEQITERVKVGFVGTCEKYYTDESGVPMLRTGNITEKGIDLEDLKYVTREFHEKNKKSQIHTGDLLIARHGSNGQANVYSGPEAQCLNAVVIVPNQSIASSIFLAGLINAPMVKKQIERTLVGSTQRVVNTKSIANLKVRVPSTTVQRQYEEFVKQTDKSKVTIQQSLDALETLKKSLMQEYFG